MQTKKRSVVVGATLVWAVGSAFSVASAQPYGTMSEPSMDPMTQGGPPPDYGDPSQPGYQGYGREYQGYRRPYGRQGGYYGGQRAPAPPMGMMGQEAMEGAAPEPPGMMGGPGMMGPGMRGGPGMMGPGMRGGPGMMGPEAMGPGTMGHGMMGPGMRGGRGMMGPEAMGPGMMGPGMMGPGIMGPGMMGPGMMGPGMMGPGMGGLGQIWMLDLTEEQQSEVTKIHDELRKQHWDLQGQIFDQYPKLRELYAAEEPDAAAIGEVYGNIFDLKRQMIEAAIEANTRAQAVLTEEQREQLKSGPRGPGGQQQEQPAPSP